MIQITQTCTRLLRFQSGLKESSSMSDALLPIIHEEHAQRFVFIQDGLTAELNYRLGGSRLVITHIGVPRPLEGRGIGSALAKAGLEYARQKGMEVVPLCSFARRYIERTPEYQSLVSKSAGGWE
jgi:predicted GNAT family acetyltransferase